MEYRAQEIAHRRMKTMLETPYIRFWPRRKFIYLFEHGWTSTSSTQTLCISACRYVCVNLFTVAVQKGGRSHFKRKSYYWHLLRSPSTIYYPCISFCNFQLKCTRIARLVDSTQAFPARPVSNLPSLHLHSNTLVVFRFSFIRSTFIRSSFIRSSFIRSSLIRSTSPNNFKPSRSILTMIFSHTNSAPTSSLDSY